jgi:hypothetical protein
MSVIGALVLAAAANITVFDCEVEPIKSSYREDEKIILRTINLNPARGYAWKFEITLTAQKDGILDAEIVWPSDPLGMAGKFPALTTGKKTYAFTTYSRGPCLLTETSCMSIVNLVARPNDTAHISLLPTAMGGDFSMDTREPFRAYADGTCSIRKPKK